MDGFPSLIFIEKVFLPLDKLSSWLFLSFSCQHFFRFERFLYPLATSSSHAAVQIVRKMRVEILKIQEDERKRWTIRGERIVSRYIGKLKRKRYLPTNQKTVGSVSITIISPIVIRPNTAVDPSTRTLYVSLCASPSFPHRPPHWSNPDFHLWIFDSRADFRVTSSHRDPASFATVRSSFGVVCEKLLRFLSTTSAAAAAAAPSKGWFIISCCAQEVTLSKLSLLSVDVKNELFMLCFFSADLVLHEPDLVQLILDLLHYYLQQIKLIST